MLLIDTQYQAEWGGGPFTVYSLQHLLMAFSCIAVSKKGIHMYCIRNRAHDRAKGGGLVEAKEGKKAGRLGKVLGREG